MQGYVDRGDIAGAITLVARRGSVVHFEKFGYQDLASGKALELDTIFRIYSMTKPVTSVALMMLYERGLFQLTDPVSKYIPAFQEIKVFVSEDQRAELERPITIHDLLTHTAGFSYGYEEMTGLPVDRLYDQAGLWDPAIDNREMTRRIAALPLARQPGRAWQYSVATNVVGYLVELLSGLSLGQFFEQEIFKPLGMVDTAFTLPPDKISRLATLYALTENGLQALELDPWGFDFVNNRLQYGGGGLVSTVGDYARFAQMLLNKGQLDGARLLGRKTVELMTVNHLPPSLLPLLDGEEPRPGVGFGLGFAVTLDVAQSGLLGSVGAHSWSGMANTHFWVDPREQLIAVIALQCFPFGVHPIIDDFQTLVYQALE
jgi:CubicO group peptidase (beta-lactamase class C family)